MSTCHCSDDIRVVRRLSQRKQKLYNCTAVEKLLQKYYEHEEGLVAEIEPGCLGYGLTICYGEGLKTAVIRELPLNCWSSAHTIRMYNKMPKKYEQMLDEWWNREVE